MKALLAKIRSRGHWRVIIRPSRFVKDRVPRLAELEQIVPQCSVNSRGWDFPHINAHSPIQRGLEWVEQSTDWRHHVEFWRLYRSGQFFFEGCLWEDWKDRSAFEPAPPGWQWGQWLHAHGAVYTYTEICELAARLALSPAGAEDVVINVALRRLENRTLTFGDHHYSRPRPPATVPAFEVERTYARDEIVAAPKDAALAMAQQLFEVFGWDLTLQGLREIQDQIGHR